MSNDKRPETGQSEQREKPMQADRISRRNMLRITTATGTSAIAIPSVVAASENFTGDIPGGEKGHDQVPGKAKGRDRNIRKKGGGVYNGPIKKHLREKDIPDELREMSDEELNERFEKMQKQSTENSTQISTQDIDERCFSDTIDLTNIPAISLDLCLGGRCEWELTLGALGYSETIEQVSCQEICRTITFDAFTDILETTMCHSINKEEISFRSKYCKWRPSTGWTCSTNSGTRPYSRL
jgi:hypothetical protein